MAAEKKSFSVDAPCVCVPACACICCALSVGWNTTAVTMGLKLHSWKRQLNGILSHLLPKPKSTFIFSSIFFFTPPPQRLLQVASRHCVLVASRVAPFILLDSWFGPIQSRWAAEMFGVCVLQTTVTWFSPCDFFFFPLQFHRIFSYYRFIVTQQKGLISAVQACADLQWCDHCDTWVTHWAHLTVDSELH